MRNLALPLVLLTLLAPATVAAQGFPIAEPGTEGLRVIVNHTDSVIATYRGNSATYSNDLYLMLDGSGNPGDDGNPANDLFLFNNHSSPVGSEVFLGVFSFGTELLFRLHVNNTGYDFFTGPAERNPDGQPHARVQEEWQYGESLVSFEDLYNGPFVYNDLSFSFTNTATSVIVCDAGGPYTALVGQPITFDGSGSYGTNSTIVSYEWNMGDGSTGSGSVLEYTYPTAGVYSVSLCVTDDLDNTSCCETSAIVPGACCIAVDNCQNMTAEDCAAAGGLFVHYSSCDQIDCRIAAAPSSWGRVKTLYR